jgi:multiple sugar transport system substrate-binding protein
MRRSRFPLLLVWTLACVLLTASQCSRGEDEQFSQQQSNELTFWHFRSEPKQREALRSIVAKFEKVEHCTVKLVDLNWGDGKTKLLAAFNSGVAPDVLELGSDWVAQFSYGGVLKNLSRSKIDLTRFAPFTHPAALCRDSVYALPWTVDTRVMFVNRALLKRAGIEHIPTNYREMLQSAQTIQALGDADAAQNPASSRVYGFGANGSDEHRLVKKILPLFWSAGGTVFNDSGKCVINSRQNVSALERYLALARTGFIETQRQLDEMFVRGQIGFWVSGSWLLEKITRENPSLLYDVVPLPTFENSATNGISVAGVEYVAVNYRTPNPDLARRFALFLTNGKNALNLFRKFQDAGFPADNSTLNSMMTDETVRTLVLAVPHRDVFVKQLASARLMPVHPHWLDIERVIEDAVVEALYGIRSPEEALYRAQWLITDITTRP